MRFERMSSYQRRPPRRNQRGGDPSSTGLGSNRSVGVHDDFPAVEVRTAVAVHITRRAAVGHVGTVLAVVAADGAGRVARPRGAQEGARGAAYVRPQAWSAAARAVDIAGFPADRHFESTGSSSAVTAVAAADGVCGVARSCRAARVADGAGPAGPRGFVGLGVPIRVVAPEDPGRELLGLDKADEILVVRCGAGAGSGVEDGGEGGLARGASPARGREGQQHHRRQDCEMATAPSQHRNAAARRALVRGGFRLSVLDRVARD
ncbi:hypothetical protein DFJ74DRAFT_690939 [Hyaloraphidium curvatum]|nr:hypothetical protein DFJ74DRAFT_690939 [Hyaloraphidium curvatum]